ncbi:MAG: hypothetical protein JEZ09_17810 [Salinivirgaceae bacterium]|nr:hypothetical protein [Salinivirgaceae bacterium]
MVTVFFESNTGSHVEIAARFDSEKLYMKCLHVLEKEAHELGMTVTESVDEKSISE